MIKTHRRAAWVATLTLALGIVTSLGGNLQAINLGGREPGVGAYISAVFWPLALFAAIEVMLHTPWLASRRDNLTKWVGLASVAGMAAYVSYGHMVHVLLAYGYDKPSGHFGPLAVDGLMAMCTLALNRVGQARRAPAPVATPDLDAEAMELADAVANPDESSPPSAYAPLANRNERDWVSLDFMATTEPAMRRNPGADVPRTGPGRTWMSWPPTASCWTPPLSRPSRSSGSSSRTPSGTRRARRSASSWRAAWPASR
jgi:hypothetical protein